MQSSVCMHQPAAINGAANFAEVLANSTEVLKAATWRIDSEEQTNRYSLQDRFVNY